MEGWREMKKGSLHLQEERDSLYSDRLYNGLYNEIKRDRVESMRVGDKVNLDHQPMEV